MSQPPVTSATGTAERLARLTPQQRQLLLRRLAARAADTAATRAEMPARATPFGSALPLSPAQQRIWLFERLQPGTGAYHVYGHYRLRGTLDAAALQRACAEIVRRHDVLRTSFHEHAGEPRQVVSASIDFQITVVDLSALEPDQRELAARQRADTETECPFDLTRAPLLRVTLLRLARDEHVLLMVVHHIVSDAWSRGVLFGELARLYDAYAAGRQSPLPEPKHQFSDVVLWEREPQQEQRASAQLAFWYEALNGVTGVLELPTDRPRKATIGGRGGRRMLHLPMAVVTAITTLAQHEGATLFMALLAVFQTLLARHCGQTDIVVGAPVANRDAAEFEPLIGLFVNTLALRGDLSGDPSFRELLTRTRVHVLSALEHAQAPLERVVDGLQLQRVPGRTPLFQAMFVLQNAAGDAPALQGLATQWIEPDVHTARFELTLSLGISDSGLEGVLDYDSDLFEPATAAHMLDRFEVLLRAAIADPDRRLSQLALLTTSERHELLVLADGGLPIAGPETDLYQLVALQAARTPDAVAIVEPGRELSYRDVVRRANGIAHALRALGVGPEARVALLADRSAEAILAVLGVLAAGGAYVPLDPSHPIERLTLLLADASARALLTPRDLLARARAVAGTVPLIATDDVPVAATPPPVTLSADQAAYVIYTSGSTGKPKGVVVEHRGAVNLVRAFLARHDFKAQRLLMIPPLVFDASVGDVFPALASGSTLVLHPLPTELGPAELEHYCREHGVTAIDAPAALWRRWSEGWAAVARSEPVLPALRLMMIGGESVPLAQVQRFAATTGARVALCNHYGPTEASVCATMLTTRDGAELTGPELPIGKPLPGVRVYVLDAHGELAPRGVVGELCIGGRGVARGYLGEPELTAERFLPDPYAAVAGARLYRTGDLARWNIDDTLQFLGRRDHQTKLRGFRIELGEVETALAACPGVRAAAVAVREDRPGERRLIAYVVADADVATTQLREHLALSLPDAMLPAAFVRLDALPLTSNGKVDRRALPAPPAPALGVRVCRPASSVTEHGVLAVWRELLGRHDLGIDDEFFAVGGDSLSTLPLVFKLHAKFGIELPLAAVFATPTVAGLARAIDELRAGAAPQTLDIAAKAELPPDIDPRNAEPPARSRESPESVLLTGATGFLGAYLLRELLDTTVAEMLCLVRAQDSADGLRRVRANLESYGLWRAGDERRLVPVLGDLAAPQLGLDGAGFQALAQRAQVIFHNGGQVNFLAPYQVLEAANVQGTLEVLRLATRTHVKPVHLVSTLGVYLTRHYLDTTVRESDAAPSADDQQGGYNQSKWVAERLALAARERGLPVAIYRPARITGDSRNGTSNVGDYFNAWIKGCVQLGLAPRLANEAFDMAPVDYVSRAIVRLALGAGDANGNFHFFNAQRLPIAAAVAALRAAGFALAEVDYGEWRNALLADVSASRTNALAPFASLFPATPDAREPNFDCRATRDAVAPYGLFCPPADRSLFDVYLRFLKRSGFLPAAAEVEEGA